MVWLIGGSCRVMLRKELCVVPQLNSVPIIVILPLHLPLPLIDVVGRPLHMLLPLHDHVREALSFLFLPLVALRVVLSGVIECFVEFVVRWGRFLLLLLPVIYLG